MGEFHKSRPDSEKFDTPLAATKQSLSSCSATNMNSKRLCFVLLAVVALLALTSLTEAKGKVERKKLNQARCGGMLSIPYMLCHLNGRRQPGPFG